MNGDQRRPFLTLVSIGAAVGVLHWAGSPALAAPPLTSAHTFAEWLSERDPFLTAFACLRLVALVVAWYLLVSTVVGLGLRLAGAGRLVAVANRLTVPPVRRILASTLSIGLLSPTFGVAAVTVRPVAAFAAGSQDVGTVSPDDGAVSAADHPGLAEEAIDDHVTMRRLAPGEEVPVTAEASTETPTPPAPVAGEWAVAPGQSFWSIAEAVLTEAWGRSPTDAEVVPYWEGLIEANRSALADADNPHLIFPGQRFVVSSPPAAGRSG